MRSSQSRRSLRERVTRLYIVNAIAVAVVLCCWMVTFGILAGSVAAGLAFPLVVPSMAAEGSGWGVWMLSPLYFVPALLLGRENSRKRR